MPAYAAAAADVFSFPIVLTSPYALLCLPVLLTLHCLAHPSPSIALLIIHYLWLSLLVLHPTTPCSYFTLQPPALPATRPQIVIASAQSVNRVQYVLMAVEGCLCSFLVILWIVYITTRVCATLERLQTRHPLLFGWRSCFVKKAVAIQFLSLLHSLGCGLALYAETVVFSDRSVIAELLILCCALIIKKLHPHVCCPPLKPAHDQCAL